MLYSVKSMSPRLSHYQTDAAVHKNAANLQICAVPAVLPATRFGKISHTVRASYSTSIAVLLFLLELGVNQPGRATYSFVPARLTKTLFAVLWQRINCAI